MKKICNFLILIMLMFIMTGCVKFNANMTIEKDKSMEFDIIYAVDATYFGDEGLNFTESELQGIKDSGFVVNDYSNGNMKGIKITKSVNNIDSVSSSENTNFSLSNLMNNEENNNKYLFKIEKGLLKNTYIAKFEFNSSDSSLNNSFDDVENEDDIYEESDNIISNDDELNLEDDELNLEDETDFDMDYDYSSMMAGMDLSFNVNLPYSATSNNATEVSNEGKTLKWNLMSNGESEFIEFKFQLYNMTTIYIGIGIIILLIIAIIFLIIKKFGKKKNKLIDNQNNIQNETSIPNNNLMNNNQNNNMISGLSVLDMKPQFDNSNNINLGQQQEIQSNNILENDNIGNNLNNSNVINNQFIQSNQLNNEFINGQNNQNINQ